MEVLYMKAFNGYSTNPNPTEAGLEAAKMAGNAKSAKLVFAYTSCDYDVKKVISGLSQYYNCPIIGNTSFTGVDRMFALLLRQTIFVIFTIGRGQYCVFFVACGHWSPS